MSRSSAELTNSKEKLLTWCRLDLSQILHESCTETEIFVLLGEAG